MYHITVPVIAKYLNRIHREKTLACLQSMDAKRVLLALGDDFYDDSPALFNCLKENTDFFHRHGMEAGTWIWTFNYGKENRFTPMESPTGFRASAPGPYCPSDEGFVKTVCDYLKKLAATGVDLILFDDDFRYGFVEGHLCCTCPNHRNKMEEFLGEALPENLKDFLFAGGENKVRSAFLKANRFYFEAFAKACRKAVDEINPSVRLGLCSCISGWDFDGIASDELARLLAGEHTKPFLRLIGAPYWASNRSFGGTRLQHSIEFIRMERSWCRDGLEIVSEGDTFPRPRYVCPASYLEGYDMALRADGRLDGIMKYGHDYYGSAGYEPGYALRHQQNKPLYEGIDRLFSRKTAVGVRIWEIQHKFEKTHIPKEIAGTDQVENQFFSPAAKLLSDLSIPTVYEGTGCCGIAFGENARHLPEEAFSRGLILDLRAAEILTEQGIDVGLVSVGQPCSRYEEYFPAQGEAAPCFFPMKELRLKESAQIDSVYQDFPDQNPIPAAWYYENARGQRFFVLAFSAHFAPKDFDRTWRSYLKQKQLTEAVKRLSGAPLPAHVEKAPDLYILAKEGPDGSLAVGLWNIHPDDIPAPVVHLAKAYSHITPLNCRAQLNGNTATLSRLEPFGFCAFEVK